LLKYFYKHQKYSEGKVRINGKEFRTIIADSPMKRMIGLMFRNSMKENTCMLFIFPSEGRHGIWMQNMSFAIDVLWLDKDSKIIHTEERLQPCNSFWNCKTYVPEKDAKYIIEMKAGAIKKNKIKKGSKIRT